MNILTHRHGKSGFVSFLLVLTAGAILTVISVYAYRQAMASHEVASQIQLRSDYREKEDVILRSIIAVTPNRVIQAMQSGSDASAATRDRLRWQNIFSESLDMANARASISSDLINTLNLPNVIVANSGDSALSDTSRIFSKIAQDTASTGIVSPGLNRSLGDGFPVPLESDINTTFTKDSIYPIIADDKHYGTLAQSGVLLSVDSYSKFNVLTYPQINFGYAKPGDPFVAKQNWWAFSMKLGAHDELVTSVTGMRRNFVMSIYEIPSQLAISASSFMSLGEFSSGESWGDVSITGGVFAGKAEVTGETQLSALASRRSMSLASDARIGGQDFSNNPFAPGAREAYQVTEGDFFPVSLASESGRVAFIPINRGADFFDRFAHSPETQTISPTSWDSYSVGALQCAMQLDIIDAVSSLNNTATKLRFSYFKNGERKTLNINLLVGEFNGLPPGYLFACNEGQAYNFKDAVVDLAYGANGSYAFQNDQSGLVTFNNARFDDPAGGAEKSGFYRPSYPFEITQLATGKICVAVYPQRFKQFLEAINADDTSVNNSLVVNVDYSTATGSTYLSKPLIPSTDLDYGLVLNECADLTSFPKGFSLVTNLRTYIGDDFNVVKGTPPSGYTPAGDYYPPCSIFTPEKRYGIDIDPNAIQLTGQVGSVVSESASTAVRPLDAKVASGADMNASQIKVNLRPITHPAELPPITMMNWLVTITEVRSEFVNY